MLVTKDRLVQFFPETPVATIEKFVVPLNKTLNRFNINTTNRIAMFLAQVGHESNNFTTIRENLNYRVTALTAKFGNRISNSDAQRYGRNEDIGQSANQEAIANLIYGGTWGTKNLGNTSVGDGWKFRGRGLIQLTGKANYSRFAASNGMTIEQAVIHLETFDGATFSAGWFWNQTNLNQFADAKDIVGCTKKINGGDYGLKERTEAFNEGLRIFA